ncbi:MAG: translation elongation factor G [Clostridiales bacterium 45_37]|nr:MAG: translation elongation factor G [Clostridiales bacterium 45_37]
MGEKPQKIQEQKHISLGVLAHVDAGKTTLSEGLLFKCGRIRKIGRVDHKDAYLDTYELERERGITIFSKQAVFSMGDMEVTLLDTPGHVDFSAEMERTLQVLDYAILVINGADGVQGHTQTLWRLLNQYQIPTFLFVNKMDQDGTNRESLLEELKKKLSENCVDFRGELDCCGAEEDSDIKGTVDKAGEVHGTDEFLENIAVCEEALMEQFLDTGIIVKKDVARLILERKLFPCFFGSALKMEGVDAFIRGMETYMAAPVYPSEFGAKVFKIARDDQGNRLTYMKITGGSLKVKETLTNAGRKGIPDEEIWEEKVDQIRIYSGAKFEMLKEAEAGTVCAVTGLTETYPGEGLGVERESVMPVLEPVLNYQIILPEGCDAHKMLKSLKELEEEEPQLHIMWDEQLGEIHAMLMGEVQIEILKHLIWERFHVAVEFGTGNIVYKETIAAPVEGVGHFEPLRHYAEVHLLLEPGERGSGLQFFTAASEDQLDRNWQRLILTHLEEKEHLGVLTGSPITDMQITLLTGRAHQKHTEGGDFRQATYRAVRQGLKKAKTVLLEPYYSFRLELPAENVGRAMTDIQRMQGNFQGPETEGELAVITGSAPVAKMRDYQSQVISYTRGKGHLTCTLKGYEPCQDQEQIVQEIGYDSERDLENPTGSVFCAHGAGFVVPWYEVEEYMHLDGAEIQDWDDAYDDSGDSSTGTAEASGRGYSVQGKDTHSTSYGTGKTSRGKYTSMYGSYEEEKELKAIFEKTFGPVKSKKYNSNSRSFGNLESGSSFYGNSGKRSQSSELPGKTSQGAWKNSNPAIHRDDYLLVDGCNIIFAWEDLRDLAQADFHAAQTRLMDILSDYQGIKGCILILVFDAYRVEGHPEETFQYHNIHVVYTREAETADQYIERTVHKIGRKHNVTVATSDGLEQIIIMGQGAARISARGFKEEIASAKQQMREEWQERRDSSKTYLFDSMTPELKSHMEDIRLGRKKKEEL